MSVRRFRTLTTRVFRVPGFWARRDPGRAAAFDDRAAPRRRDAFDRM